MSKKHIDLYSQILDISGYCAIAYDEFIINIYDYSEGGYCVDILVDDGCWVWSRIHEKLIESDGWTIFDGGYYEDEDAQGCIEWAYQYADDCIQVRKIKQEEKANA